MGIARVTKNEFLAVGGDDEAVERLAKVGTVMVVGVVLRSNKWETSRGIFSDP